MTRDPAWMASGSRLVERILIRRRNRCLTDRKHTADWPKRCKACGVDR